MPNPRFPATATLLDAKRCPLDRFDALFTKITQERRIRDGYFVQDHPDEARVLFVVNGSPYGAGRVAGEACAHSEIHEFFTAYAECPESPLSFFVADKRLLLGLMVLFRHQPAMAFKTDLVDISEVLETLAERQTDQILALRSGGEWAISLCTKGRPVANFLASDSPLGVPTPVEQLKTYVRSRADSVALDVYEETRVGPAGDVILVTPETRGRLVEVFLKVAARVREEEMAVAPMLETPPVELPEAPPVELAESPPAELLEAPSVELPEAPPVDLPEIPPAGLLEAPSVELLEPPPAALPEELPEETSAIEADAPSSFAPMADAPTEEPPASVESEAAPLELEPPMHAADVLTEAPAPPEPAAQPAPILKGPIPEVVLLHADKQLGVFSLAAGEVTIGRTPGNTIAIDNAGVSRRHAVIRVKGDKVVLEDLGSANGTFVRGQRIEEYELRDGDEIAIVKHRLVYRVPKDAETQARVEPIQDVGQKTMYIDAATVAQALGGRQGGRAEAAATTLRPRLILPDLKKFPLEEDEVRLGSGPGCQIPLSGMFVGKLHARIVRTKDGQLKIQHLSGLAGTRVNGEKIAEHLLKHGDEIEIGKQKLLFRLER
ncbi:MAG: signal peptide protein [candidate division NC10 bacterium]|nr:signal peptide protein [candidate division NC10 bacterium]